SAGRRERSGGRTGACRGSFVRWSSDGVAHYPEASAMTPWPLRRVEVAGDSMRPTLEPGDRLVVWAPGPVRAGDLVAVRDPRNPARTVVKRVAAVGGEGVAVVGDNPDASTDSR